MPTFLHVGCGPKRKDRTTRGFNTPEWTEIRLDIDASVRPDVVGTMTDMSVVPDESVDAVFSSHNIEHLYPHEVPIALAEFRRVLRPEGAVVMTCPDLQTVCALVADNKLLEPAYQSGAGPISPLDILYGHRAAMEQGNLFMAHRTGFTRDTLAQEMRQAGFGTVFVRRRPQFLDLWTVATKSVTTAEHVQALAAAHVPTGAK